MLFFHNLTNCMPKMCMDLIQSDSTWMFGIGCDEKTSYSLGLPHCFLFSWFGKAKKNQVCQLKIDNNRTKYSTSCPDELSVPSLCFYSL